MKKVHRGLEDVPQAKFITVRDYKNKLSDSLSWYISSHARTCPMGIPTHTRLQPDKQPLNEGYQSGACPWGDGRIISIKQQSCENHVTSDSIWTILDLNKEMKIYNQAWILRAASPDFDFLFSEINPRLHSSFPMRFKQPDLDLNHDVCCSTRKTYGPKINSYQINLRFDA